MATRILIATTSDQALPTAQEEIQNRELLINKDTQTLFMKLDNRLIPIGGTAKQDVLLDGKNVEINQETGVIDLKDDIIVKTCTLSPEETLLDWKGTVKLGELNNNSILILLKASGLDSATGLLGGDILVKLTDQNGAVTYGQYDLSLTSTGSWSIKGGVNAVSEVRVAKIKYNNTEYYGLKFPGLNKENLESKYAKVEVWFNGWKDIGSDLLPPTSYIDEDLTYEVLSESAKEDFNDIIEVPPEITDQGQAAVDIIKELEKTGEDGKPYKLTLSGTLTLADLVAIAETCRDPEKQIYLDLSQCTVARDAQVWNIGLFRSCVSLRGLVIPQGVRQIIGTEFIWCTYLRTLDFSPSNGTLTDLGASSSWGTSIGLLTSTRVRLLVIPNSVTELHNYLIGSSNLKKFVLTHQNNEPLALNGWTFQIYDSDGNLTSDIPEEFNLYMPESWWNGYLDQTYKGNKASLRWQWNSTSHWTREVVETIITYDPYWSKEQWQTFATEHSWTEDEVNYVRQCFGLSDWIEIISA